MRHSSNNTTSFATLPSRASRDRANHAIDRAALHSLVATSPDDDPRLREMDRILRVGTTATTPTRSLRTFNIKEAAQQANVSRATIYRAIEARVLRAGPLYTGGRKRVLEADLEAWLSKRERLS